MKSIFCLIVCFFWIAGSVAIHPAMAQDATADPLISLTAKNEPLGDVLETITRDTGYRFNLNGSWNEHPVSATIINLPLEKGLKRLLRSLNHSIVWESDKIVTITVFGKAEAGRSDTATTFASPPQTYQEENEPAAETEPEPAEAEVAGAEEANPESGQGASTQEATILRDPSAMEEAVPGSSPGVE